MVSILPMRKLISIQTWDAKKLSRKILVTKKQRWNSIPGLFDSKNLFMIITYKWIILFAPYLRTHRPNGIHLHSLGVCQRLPSY